ncbi:carboxylesterase 1D-like [Branchiostoma floridae x Branchiostoma japonicum]
MATTTMSQLLVFAALVSVGYAGALPPKPDGPIVHTRYGDVRGMYAEEGAIFLGLPFGVPPVGELRWKPPQAYNKSWAPDVRDGTVPGPACRQGGCHPGDTDYQHTCNRDKNRTQSEDCLYLNVFVPRSVLANSSVRLPVMCWLHGGEYRYGTAGAMVYDGRILANKTNTVVVTTNYRLGAFGYLNIADFGGDKDKVTVIGQSAGSDSIAVLLTSARAADLFHQGIMLSVPFSITHKTQFQANRLGNDVAKLANCSAGDMKCLRSNFTEADEQILADTMAYHYGNFAHTGDPNKPGPHVYTPDSVLKSPLNWPRYSEGNQYPNMNFTTPHNVMVHAYNKEKCDFWDKENVYSGTD